VTHEERAGGSDPPKMGDYPKATAVFDLDSIGPSSFPSLSFVIRPDCAHMPWTPAFASTQLPRQHHTPVLRAHGRSR
jgi:hypothetical protein